MSSNYLAQVGTTTVAGDNATSLQKWGGAIALSLIDLWQQFIGFIPSLIAALVVFFVGWAIAIAVGRIVEKLLVILRINQAFENIKGLKEAAGRASLKINIPLLIGEIVKWFLLVVTLLATTDILGLQEVSMFLREVLAYIPNVVVAALILVIAVVLGNFVHRTVEASVRAAGFGASSIIAAISKWAIIIFAFMAALVQLNVVPSLIQTILMALFAMLALAGGLAFGLGGKDLASKWLQKIEGDVVGRKRS